MNINRLHAFSDGVYAIIITILVLELKIPEYEPHHLLEGILSQAPMFIAFIISFLYVGTLWLYHHDFFSTIKIADKKLNLINLIILFTSTIIVYPTALLSESFIHFNTDDVQVAVILYALTAMLCSASYIPIYPHLIKHMDLVNANVSINFYKESKYGPYISISIYLLAILISFVNVYIALIIIIIGILFHFYAYQKMNKTLHRNKNL